MKQILQYSSQYVFQIVYNLITASIGSYAWEKFDILEKQIIFQDDNSGGLKCPIFKHKMKIQVDIFKKYMGCASELFI